MNAMANETREQRIVGMQTQNAQYEGVIDVKRNWVRFNAAASAPSSFTCGYENKQLFWLSPW